MNVDEPSRSFTIRIKLGVSDESAILVRPYRLYGTFARDVINGRFD